MSVACDAWRIRARIGLVADAVPDIPTLFAAMHVEVEHRFDLAIGDVWALLSDVERMAGLGPEHVEAVWTTVDRGPGSEFTGKNRRGDMEWEVPCFVTECDPPSRFAWTVLEPDNPSSRWSYTLSPDGEGTVVVQRFEHGPNYSFTRLWAASTASASSAVNCSVLAE